MLGARGLRIRVTGEERGVHGIRADTTEGVKHEALRNITILFSILLKQYKFHPASYPLMFTRNEWIPDYICNVSSAEIRNYSLLDGNRCPTFTHAI